MMLISFLVGLFIGCGVAMVAVAIAIVASDADDMDEYWDKHDQMIWAGRTGEKADGGKLDKKDNG